MATLDERHSTRGRGNALRLAISGQFGTPGVPSWDDPATIETLDLCLSCKACKSECPSNVDIARLKSEYTAQRYRATGRVPRSARAMGHVRFLNRLGSMMPRLANWAGRLGLSRWLAHRILGISPRRSLPRFERSLYSQWRSEEAPSRNGGPPPKVVLFADCFTTYNEPHIGLAAQRVLHHLGYDVELLPRQGDGGFGSGCCARSMISLGLPEDAIATADRTLESLRPAIEDPAVEAILVCEPSCLSAFKDDWLQLKLRTPLPLRQQLAAKSFLVEDFVSRLPNLSSFIIHHSSFPSVLLHAHCHQKALWGAETSAAALRAVVGDRLSLLDSGCCGMAGSFGYAAHRFDLSMRIGELALMPAIRAAGETAVIVAPGTSCRHQIKDATARRAVHPIEFIAQAIAL
jgi:Fe-S oxidoreductase